MAEQIAISLAENLPRLISAFIILIIGIIIASIFAAIVYLIFYLIGKAVGYNNYKVIQKYNITIPKIGSGLIFIFVFMTALRLFFHKLGI